MRRRDRLKPCLQHGEEANETSGESASAVGDGGGCAGELRDRGSRRAGLGDSAVASSDGSLGLAVGDLGNDVGNGGSRSAGLGLAIRDLRDDLGDRRQGCAGLGLAV